VKQSKSFCCSTDEIAEEARRLVMDEIPKYV